MGRGCRMQARFVPGGLFFYVSGCTWKSTGGVHGNAVCMQDDNWEILGVQEAWLSWTANDCVLFFLKYSFRRAMLQLEFRESKSKPEESHFEQSQRHRKYAACTVEGDDVWTLTTHETRLSCRLTVAYFSSKVLSETSKAPTWVYMIQIRWKTPKTVQNGDKKSSVSLVENTEIIWQVTDRPRPDAPSLTQTIIVQMVYCKGPDVCIMYML